MKKELEVAYGPQSVSLFNESTSTESLLRRDSQCRIDTRSRWANTHGDLSVLAQWHAIGVCYDACEAHERRTGQQYSWILRLRTDFVPFADIPLLDTLGINHVFVPSNGMTGDPAYRCMNDQVFACPRHLCRPYFRLLELFASPLCAGRQGQQRQEGDTTAAMGDIFAEKLGSPNGQHSSPSSPYILPQPPDLEHGPLPRMTAQYYFFARYNLKGAKPCTATVETPQCCGMIREFAWPYSIARIGRSHELECRTRLTSYPTLSPRNKDFGLRPNFWANRSLYLQRCRDMQIEWRKACEGKEDRHMSWSRC